MGTGIPAGQVAIFGDGGVQVRVSIIGYGHESGS